MCIIEFIANIYYSLYKYIIKSAYDEAVVADGDDSVSVFTHFLPLLSHEHLYLQSLSTVIFPQLSSDSDPNSDSDYAKVFAFFTF